MAGLTKRRAAAEVIKANWEELLAELREGKSLKNASIAVGVASESGLLWLMKQEPARAEQVADARKAGADAMASAVMDIADETGELTLADPIRVAEMRIKARQWTAAKLNRDTYGEQQKGAQVTVNIAGLHLDALRRQPAAIERDVIDAEVVELPRLNQETLDDLL